MRRVLVVDDDRQMVRTLCDILDLHGWVTEARHTGEEAVAAAAEREFAAVLMHVRTQGSGVEALARIRRLRPRARVILMTAFSIAELLRQAELDGALQILAKPVAPPVLIPLFATVLDGGDPVLIVDDDPEFLRSLADLLRAGGFPLLEASSLDHGLAFLQEKKPLAAVLHLRLGSLGPVDAVLAIRQASPAVAVILCSGHPDVIDRTRATAAAGSVYGAVKKPFAPDHLIGMLDELVHGF